MKLFNFIFLFSSFIYSQNDITEYGLKSGLKRLETMTYNNVEKIKNEWIIKDSTSLKTILFFNKDGNIDSTSVTITKKDTIIKSSEIYDFFNGLKSGKKLYNVRNELIEVTKFNWLSKKSYEELVFINDSIARKNINSLSDYGNVIRREEYILFVDKFKLIKTLVFDRKSYGPASQIKIFNDENKLIETRDYYSLKKDQFNYPIIILIDDKKKFKLIKRNYIYY